MTKGNKRASSARSEFKYIRLNKAVCFTLIIGGLLMRLKKTNYSLACDEFEGSSLFNPKSVIEFLFARLPAKH